MYVIVYTVKMTVGDLEFSADFYHGLTVPFDAQTPSDILRMYLLGKQIAVKRLNKTVCVRDKFDYRLNTRPDMKRRVILRALPMRRHNLREQMRRPLSCMPLIKQSKCRAVVSSSNVAVTKEEPPLQVDINSPPDSPLQSDGGSGGGGTQALGISNTPQESWGPVETFAWLLSNRYTGSGAGGGLVTHSHNLASYSGADLLRLSRDDLIQLCGVSDGIRLYNALHVRVLAPKLTLYMCVDPRDRVYHVVYLSILTASELLRKVCTAIGLPMTQVSSLYLMRDQGQLPIEMKLVPTDELVSHLPDHTAYNITLQSDGEEKFQLLLKQVETPHTPI